MFSILGHKVGVKKLRTCESKVFKGIKNSVGAQVNHYCGFNGSVLDSLMYSILLTAV